MVTLRFDCVKIFVKNIHFRHLDRVGVMIHDDVSMFSQKSQVDRFSTLISLAYLMILKPLATCTHLTDIYHGN